MGSTCKIVMAAQCVLVAATLGDRAFAGMDCIDGVCFIDRGASGEIDLGNLRGGIAVIDFDGDGFPDLIVGDNQDLANRLFHNQPEPGQPGQRTFVDVTAGSGLDDADGTSRSAAGVVVADYDNDGDTDIFMIGFHHDSNSHGLLYRNDGGVFTNVSIDAGVRRTGYAPSSASWNDYDLDGFVDLLICSWQGSINNFLLYHNNGDGTFSEVTDLLPAIPEFRTAYSHLWMDYDQDGYADCFVLVDIGPSVLFKNIDDGQGGRTFINVASDVGYTNLGNGPMGIAAGDYDGDGDLDIGLSNTSAGRYYENIGGSFVQVFPFSSIWGWGVSWIDVENDGDLDFYMCGSYTNGGGGANFDRLFRNFGGGGFDDVSPALNGLSASSMHSVQIDFNNDGLQDLITINPGVPGEFISVYENRSTTNNHWIKIRLRGTSSGINGDAIGAVVRVTAGGVTQIREVMSGSSLTATEDLRAHFGLGDAAEVDQIEVIWPRQGSMASRTDVYTGPFPANQIMTLEPVATGCASSDFDGDGSVGAFDLALLLGSWGPCPGCPADLDGDGSVGAFDLALLLGSWGPCE
ncbi:MAG: VCBS repeat-containing protein [Planctomycetes bacterium]|nr:VCBS repeat-containing protein [Planctomycetota bacterium]